MFQILYYYFLLVEMAHGFCAQHMKIPHFQYFQFFFKNKKKTLVSYTNYIFTYKIYTYLFIYTQKFIFVVYIYNFTILYLL